MKRYPSQEELVSLVHYDPKTGLFFRRSDMSKPAGFLDHKGYVIMKFKGVNFRANRLAYLYVYGDVPNDMQVDHKNRIKTDNRLKNLRLVTNAENCCNRDVSVKNTSGVKGLSWCKRNQKWSARVMMNGRMKHVGYFLDKHEAEKAVKAARRSIQGVFS